MPSERLDSGLVSSLHCKPTDCSVQEGASWIECGDYIVVNESLHGILKETFICATGIKQMCDIRGAVSLQPRGAMAA